MTVIGAYAIRNSVSDVAIMITLGAVGWVAANRGFAVSPIVLGLILGRIAEQGFVQSWTIGSAIGNLPAQFFGRPLSIAIIILTAITFIYPFIPRLRGAVQRQSAPPPEMTAEHPTTSAGAKWREAIALAAFGIVAAVVIGQMWGRTQEAAVFPMTAAITMAVLVVLAFLKLAITGTVTEEDTPGSRVRRALVPLVMLATTFAIPVLGFGASGILMALVLYFVAEHEPRPIGQRLVLMAAIAAIVAAFTFAFTELLSVPLPDGLLF